MPERSFETLRREFLAAGFAPGPAKRLVGELEDHYQDLIAEAVASGLPEQQAADDALVRLGSHEVLVQTALDHTPAGYLATDGVLLDTTAQFRRWCAAVCCSALFTAGLLFVLQLAIIQ